MACKSVFLACERHALHSSTAILMSNLKFSSRAAEIAGIERVNASWSRGRYNDMPNLKYSDLQNFFKGSCQVQFYLQHIAHLQIILATSIFHVSAERFHVVNHLLKLVVPRLWVIDFCGGPRATASGVDSSWCQRNRWDAWRNRRRQRPGGDVVTSHVHGLRGQALCCRMVPLCMSIELAVPGRQLLSHRRLERRYQRLLDVVKVVPTNHLQNYWQHKKNRQAKKICAFGAWGLAWM